MLFAAQFVFYAVAFLVYRVVIRLVNDVSGLAAWTMCWA